MSRMAFLTRFGAFPGRAAQPIDRRPEAPVVFLDQIEPLDRHEQPVVAGVSQLEEFLHPVVDADLLQPGERADPVVDMDDEVSGFEVAQVRDNALVAAAGDPVRGALLRTRPIRRKPAARPTGGGSLATLPVATSTAAYRASSARSTGIGEDSYSLRSSMVRSARPAVAATNSVVSPLSRSRRISATQSPRRPCTIAG